MNLAGRRIPTLTSVVPLLRESDSFSQSLRSSVDSNWKSFTSKREWTGRGNEVKTSAWNQAPMVGYEVINAGYSYLVYCVSHFFTFGDFTQDALNRSAPNEYLRLLVVVSNVILDGGDQFLDGVKTATPDALLGQITKPTFDQVQPRARSRCEVQMNARVTSQPGFRAWVFVSAVVADDQMQFRFSGRPGVNALYKTYEFLVSVLAACSRQSLSGPTCSRQRKWGGRSVTLVIMGHGPAATRLHRQTRLGTI